MLLLLLLKKDSVKIQFHACKLDKKDFFGKSDPFLTLSRANNDGSYVDLFLFFVTLVKIKILII